MSRVDHDAVPMVELWRGGLLECVHHGHAVICDASGVRQAWGDPQAVIFPRSSAKMIQALPLVESGAADAAGLGTAQLALSCASHIGASYHTTRVADWIATLGLTDDDFRCGAHEPGERAAREALIRAGEKPCQIHNNCSGKHAGFLTLNRHLGGHADYIEIDHGVQVAIKAAFEEVSGEASPGWGIDGCSAPNFATTVEGLARAMADFAAAPGKSGARAAAQVRLTDAMRAHPELISGEGRACTELMRATGGRAAIKGGAEGVYVAIIPDLGVGLALKITDGAARASEAAVAALLVKLDVIAADHPAAVARMGAPLVNWRGFHTGETRMAAALA